MQTTKATKTARKLAETVAPVAPVETGAAAPVAEKPATDKAAAPIVRGLARDAATVTAQRTNFGQYSDRDTAYLAFIGSVCRANNGNATLRQIYDAGAIRDGKSYNPRYAGPSAKATDAGAINRLIKAGYFTKSADGNTLSATPKATASAAYNA